MAKINQEIIKIVKENASNSSLNKLLRDKFGWGKTKTYEVIKEARERLTLEPEGEESFLSYSDNYIYNKQDDTYVIYSDSAKRNLVFKGELIRRLLEQYSSTINNPKSITEICREFKISRPLFIEIKTKLGWTHSSLPYTDENLKDTPETDVVLDMLQAKKFSIWQKFEQEKWKQTESDALNWRNFKALRLNPLENFLANWTPKRYAPPKRTGTYYEPESNVFLVGAFDWQVGAYADPAKLNYGDEWNTSIAEEKIKEFVHKISDDINNFNFSFEKGVLCLGGDLNHGFNGKTAKGTILKCDTLGERQFDAIFNSLVYFISSLNCLFSYVDIHCVMGNHEGFDYYPLTVALKSYFREHREIDFHIHRSGTGMFKVKNTLVVLDHGASADYKTDVPKGGTAQKSYVQSLLMRKPEMLVGVNHKIFICGDKHFYEQIDHGDFEFFRFGALPLGDEYADDLNLNARPRQNCLIIGEEGVKAVFHYYV